MSNPARSGEGFGIAGITPETEQLFSARARQRDAFIERYTETFGHRPNKRRVEQFIKEDKGAAEVRFRAEFKAAFGKLPDKAAVEAFAIDWRDRKLTEISTPEVRQRQCERIGQDGLQAVGETVRAARERADKGVALPTGKSLKEAARMGLDHCLERTSVARVGDVLAEALRFGSRRTGDLDPRGLYDQLHSRSGAISDGYQITTDQVLEEEARVLRFAGRTRGQFRPLADASGARLEVLDGDQRQAVEALCQSRAGIAVLIGDAGTGKTHALARLDEARRKATGVGLIALAPTTRATAELQANGYPEAATVAAFLASERLQEAAVERAILVDEAGFLSTRQLAELVRVAEERGARLVLVGDTKQHESVERGSALRSLIESKLVKPERLTQVRRQHDIAHRRIAKLLANGQSLKALEAAEAAGMVREIPDARELFEEAAKHYADALQTGRETLVVIPTWADIDRFNLEARAELKARGLIRGAEIEVRGTASLSWTEVERCHWQGYRPGMVLNFHCAASGMKPGESATVRQVLEDGIVAERPDGSLATIRRKQRGAFDVAEERKLAIAAGDELLFRANCPAIGVSNGERRRVESVDAEGKAVTLAGGKILPDNFTQFSHGHAVTSHKSQGASVQESILVVGPESLGATNLRQFYVSNTRFQEGHRLFAHNLAALKGAVASRSERMLAREFVAGLGKELGTLMAEAEKAKAKATPSASDALAARRRGARIKELLREVAKHERRAKTAASFHAFWSQSGGRLLPKRIQKWIQGRRTHREKQRRGNSAKLKAMARSVRKSHQVAGWFRRARAGVRSTGRRL